VATGRVFGPDADAPDPGGIPVPGKVRLHPSLRQLLIADCLVRLCEGLPDVFLVLWAIEVVHVSPSQFGILTAILTATAIVSYFPAAVLAGRAEKKSFVVLTYVFFSLFPLAVVLSRSFAALAAAFVLGGLREIGEPARKALIVDLSDPGARGRTVGLYYAIRGFSVAGAAAIGGVLWTVRPALTFVVAAVLGLVGTSWAALFLRPR
jgi:MFS family permease